MWAAEPITEERWAAVSAVLKEEGWELENVPGCVATLDLELNLLIPPETLLYDLREWAREEAGEVCDALGLLLEVLQQR